MGLNEWEPNLAPGHCKEGVELAAIEQGNRDELVVMGMQLLWPSD